jgi:hypothetical protein
MFREYFIKRATFNSPHIMRCPSKAAASVLIRAPTEDTVLSIPNSVGEEGSKLWPIPKGQRVSLMYNL